jgi:hypothetical protein
VYRSPTRLRPSGENLTGAAGQRHRSWMNELLVGYARVSTEQQDLRQVKDDRQASRETLAGRGSWVLASPSQVVGNQRGERLSRRMSPADAKRVSGRVGVYLVTLFGIQIRRWLEQSGAQRDRLFVRSSWFVDVEIEMHLLLRDPVRPVGRHMVRCKLHANPPLTNGVDDAMPRLVLEDMAAENPSPERALGLQVDRVEHDHVTHHLHHGVDATGCHRPRGQVPYQRCRKPSVLRGGGFTARRPFTEDVLPGNAFPRKTRRAAATQAERTDVDCSGA